MVGCIPKFFLGPVTMKVKHAVLCHEDFWIDKVAMTMVPLGKLEKLNKKQTSPSDESRIFLSL